MKAKQRKRRTRILTVRDFVRSINNIDKRLRKLEHRERVITGFSTDVMGYEIPTPNDSDDWPDDEFFYVEDKRRKQ
jgi:hypothetical protein